MNLGYDWVVTPRTALYVDSECDAQDFVTQLQFNSLCKQLGFAEDLPGRAPQVLARILVNVPIGLSVYQEQRTSPGKERDIVYSVNVMYQLYVTEPRVRKLWPDNICNNWPSWSSHRAR